MNFIAAPLAAPAPLAERNQRAYGRLALSFAANGPATRIQNFYQEGSLKARLPRPAEPGICEAVLMNISGGVAGGDDLATQISLAPGAHAAIATAAAERIYRSLGPASEIHTHIDVAEAAQLAYLPQETILFDGFALNRTLTIALAPSSTYLGVESIIFGRQSMGEVIAQGFLRDAITLTRNGQLIIQDSTRLDGAIAAKLRRPATAAGAIAMASLIYAAPDAAAKLQPVRTALQGATAGATLMEGILIARILAPNAATLRHYVIAALSLCQGGRALPRVWQS